MDSKHDTVQERASIVKSYFELKSPISVQRKFRTDFPGRSPPSRLTIMRLVGKFSDSGHVAMHRKETVVGQGLQGLLSTLKTGDNAWRLRQENRPDTVETGVSRTSVRRIMRTDLQLFPYKIQILQAQTPANKAERLNFCQNISQRIENQPDLLPGRQTHLQTHR